MAVGFEVMFSADCVGDKFKVLEHTMAFGRRR
jgi:hypothetical protein